MRSITLKFLMIASLVCAAIFTAVLAVGGYYESLPFVLEVPRHARQHSDIVAIYWSGDMGLRVGSGDRLVHALLAQGIPVLTVSSPMLFGKGRDRAFVDHEIELSLQIALARSGASRLAIIGNSFGADILGSGLGRVAPDLRRRIESVVLIAPETQVYFHANPTGIYYRGLGASEPAQTIPLLRGLPVTCIYGTAERDSLCRSIVMQTAYKVALNDGHLLRSSRKVLSAALVQAVEHPPQPFL
jgi:type IV secretory pathway VirJ component